MMKQTAALVMAALLMLALAGCGENKDNTNRPGSNSNNTTNGTNDTTNGNTTNGNTNNGNTTNDNAADNGGTADDGLTDSNGKARNGRSSYGTYRDNGNDKAFTENRGSTFGHAGQEIQRDAEQWPPTVYDTMTGTHGARGTATWRQMLDNGFVHDTDGFLLDGENACWS